MALIPSQVLSLFTQVPVRGILRSWWPRIGFGHHLDQVLHLTDEELQRLARAFMARVMESTD
jgi:hypothetical protein